MGHYFVVRDRRHDVKHYVGLSLQTVLIYVVFICGVSSVPVAKMVAAKISEMDVQRGVIGETVITLDIADTGTKREKGLSGRPSLPKNHAMLFIFDKSGEYGMWMKDMNFPLDIMWLNEYSEVIYIERNISPDTFPKVFASQKPSKYVLEFNAGFADRNGISLGDKFVLM